MSSLNMCCFIGYMGKDPESRAMPNGDTVTNFSIGVTEDWKDKQSGERKSKTEWVNCTAYRGTGEIIGKYGHKGMQVFVSGKFQTRKWQDKSGNDRWSTEIIVNEFKMLGKKSDSQDADTARNERPQPQQSRRTGGVAGEPDFESDVPF